MQNLGPPILGSPISLTSPRSALPPSPLVIMTTPPPSPMIESPSVPSSSHRRTIYYGIKRGKVPGVYTSAKRAEAQVTDYPQACVRCFSTRYAANAYVGGWNCEGRYALPKGTPYPLYEHLLITHSTPAHLLSPRRRLRAVYHPPRVFVKMDEFGLPSHPSLASSSDILTHRSSSATLRPPMASHRNSYRDSMVKAPSPLRHQVDEPPVERPWMERVHSVMGAGGMHTPPGSPEEVQRENQGVQTVTSKEKKRGSIFSLASFGRKQSAPAVTVSESRPQTPRADSSPMTPPTSPYRDLRSSRSSPALGPNSARASNARIPPSPRPAPSHRPSGLWASPPSSPLAGSEHRRPASPSLRGASPVPPPKSAPAFADSNAPAFSRAALRKSGVIMPAAAIPMPRRSPSTPSLSPSSSSSSIASSLSSNSSSLGCRSPQIQAAESDFAPPRAGFMRRPSSLSLSTSPSSSSESVATITSYSPVEADSRAYDQGGYASGALGMGAGKMGKEDRRDSGRMEERAGKKEGKGAVMKGFGRMFGMKKK